MSIINYTKMYKTTDIRIVKTRQAIFRSVIQLMSKKDFSTVTITELCKTAMINRKTFYVHYNSTSDVLSDLEDLLASGFIDIITERNIVTSKNFDPEKYIMTINELVTANQHDFDIAYPFLKSGAFLHRLGSHVGQLAFRFISERPGYFDNQVYPFSLVFTLCGLVTSYFDWIDFGKQFPIEELAEISTRAVKTPLDAILSPQQKP